MTEKQQEILRRQLIRLLAPEAVDEAFEVMTKCSDRWLASFKEELRKKSGNTACCAIDFAKMQLVRDGKMSAGGHFGNGWDDVMTQEEIDML